MILQTCIFHQTTILALIVLILRENPMCVARSLSTSPVTMMVIDFNHFSARKADIVPTLQTRTTPFLPPLPKLEPLPPTLMKK
jgi:hypothetical protein